MWQLEIVTLPTVLLTPSASKAADMAHLCVPQNQALGVCRGFVPDIQICGTHGRKDLVNATIISNVEEEEEEEIVNRVWGHSWRYFVNRLNSCGFRTHLFLNTTDRVPNQDNQPVIKLNLTLGRTGGQRLSPAFRLDPENSCVWIRFFGNHPLPHPPTPHLSPPPHPPPSHPPTLSTPPIFNPTLILSTLEWFAAPRLYDHHHSGSYSTAQTWYRLPPRWPSGYAVCLESGRPGSIPAFSAGFFFPGRVIL